MNIALSPEALPPVPLSSKDAFDITSHEEWFKKYAAIERSICPHDPYPEDLKLEHSFNVLAHARKIAVSEGYAAPLARACLLAAIYHDLARFAQYRVWKTFRDADSCNHGESGAQLAEAYHVLQHEPFVAKTVLRAIQLHNAYRLPDDLAYDTSLVTRVTRDADKLDIIRIMAGHLAHKPYEPTVVLSLPDDPDLFSQKVIDCALNDEVAGYADLASVNDFRLLLGSWFNDMHSPAAKRIMKDEGHIVRLLEALPDASYGRARDHILSLMQAQC